MADIRQIGEGKKQDERKPIRVLLLDDLEDNLLLRSTILRQNGYEVVSTSRIEDAAAKLQDIDIAVLDYHLGAGQFYLMSTMDKHGRPLDGSRTYRLTGERAGHAILVGGSLRPGDPCPHPGRLFAEQVVANGGRQDQP